MSAFDRGQARELVDAALARAAQAIINDGLESSLDFAPGVEFAVTVAVLAHWCRLVAGMPPVADANDLLALDLANPKGMT